MMPIIPANIVIKNISNPTSIRKRIENHLQKLFSYSDKIQHPHVVVSADKSKSLKSLLFDMHVDLIFSGKKFVVSHIKNKDVYFAIHEAFNKIEHQIKNHLSKMNKLNIYANHLLKFHNLNFKENLQRSLN